MPLTQPEFLTGPAAGGLRPPGGVPRAGRQRVGLACRLPAPTVGSQ